MNTSTCSQQPAQMRLYDQTNRRLYVNAEERRRFIAVANDQDLPQKALCLTLLHTGCRLSEALSLTSEAVDTMSHLVSIRTLKKRDKHHIREIPIPPVLTRTLASLMEAQANENFLWPENLNRPVCRITGYRWVKRVMSAAGISGAQASPKGLRHGYGVYALRCGVPLTMLRKWMGHASIETTAIYTNAVGKEEMEFAGRMWS